jgi:hypothetical protein
MQITAELDNQHIEKLQTLEKTLQKNTSEFFAFAIDIIFTNKVVKIEEQANIYISIPNEQTQMAMLDVRAKKNLESVTLEQLQHEIESQ